MEIECHKCGKCCSPYLPLTEKDKKRIRYVVKRLDLRPQRIKFGCVCPFLDTGNNCVIYKDRPLICRFFYCQNTKIMPKEEFEQMKDATATDMWSFFE